MRFSVVIPAYNSAATIGETLSSLREFFDAGDEVIVVDDGSLDTSPAIAGQYPVHVEILPEHAGPAAARNRGARLARHPWLLFLDSDVACPPGIRERLLSCAAGQDAVQGIYAPISCDANRMTVYQNNYYHHVFRGIARRDTAVCATFFFGIRSRLFWQIGGFDDSITDPTVEDEKFGYALHEQGKKIRVCPGLQVHHLARYTMRRFLVRRFTMARRQSQTFLQHKGETGLLRFLSLNAARKTHHRPTILLGLALLPCAYLVLLAGLLGQSAAVLALGSAVFVLPFLLNADLLAALMRLSGRHASSIPFLFLLDLNTLLAGLALGLVQRNRGSRP